MNLDPRTHAFRPDLADLSLQARVQAYRFIEPVIRQCVAGILPVYGTPDCSGSMTTQLRYGEFVDVFERRDDGVAWVQSRTDRYVGYIHDNDVFSENIAALSSKINVLRSFVYEKPDIKSTVIDVLTLGSCVPSVSEGDFIELVNGGYVFARHVVPADDALTPDYVFTAGRLLGVPYLWGGRTPIGIDCSGLVQLALELAGYDAPRDSDQQRDAYGNPLETHWRDHQWRRGEIVFFPGHVGIMTDGENMIHASGYDMQVVVEPLAAVVARGNAITASGFPR